MAVQNSLSLDNSRRELQAAPAEALLSRQAQEVQAAMIVAKRFPRDVQDAMNRILSSCQRASLAEQSTYEYARGGSKITGPSIRLAETMAQCWGNLDFGVTELEQRVGESTVMAYAWDLETNTRQCKIFNVQHIRKTKDQTKTLDDPRDIYEAVANNGARRLRACILGIIPGDIVDMAVAECEKTLAQNKKKVPLTERIKKMVDTFKTIDVVESQLAAFIGKESTNDFSDGDLDRLRKVYAAIKDNLAKKEDQFPPVIGGKEEAQPEVAAEEEFPL
jgi:hypothetical protein